MFCYKTSLGKIYIDEDNGFITNISFTENINAPLLETELIKKTYIEISEYLSGARKEFDIPINPKGTNFQKRVWDKLLEIPYGKTMSYQDIAISLNNQKASRAIGYANNKNPIAIIIPCHRVIGKNGNLTGYSGGISIKEKLLKLEAEVSQ